MNQRLLAVAIAVLVGGAMAITPVLAQTPAPASSSAQPAASAASQRSAKAVPPLDSRQCIRDTGSHIPPPKGQCLPVAGNSYGQQDIQRTGSPTVGGALRMLDPSITVHGH